ncbi:MAG TPA: hypothetical protein VMV94_17380 [Phycisphaerae bacterium]|nr:hypothetical protein [Phycisphaerae bacterium]
MAADNLLVISVTRLGDGICVACVDEAGRWIRPTRQEPDGWRQLRLGALRDDRGQIVVKAGNVVHWPMGRPAPREVHSEDVFVGAAHPRLVRALAPAELAARCQNLCEEGFLGFLRGTDRSLMLLRPQLIEQVSFSIRGKGGVAARILVASDAGHQDLSVTDLAWRALGRDLLDRSRADALSWKPTEFLRHTGLTVRYLAVGKGQPWHEGPLHPVSGRFWPFVTTVFTDPPVSTQIDYANL